MTRRIATTVVAAALTTASLFGSVAIGGGAAAAPARHHHHTHCTTKHHHPYPPGKCYIVFNRSKYHHRQPVRFKAKDFNSFQHVKIHIRCGKFHKRVKGADANANGRVKNHFPLPKGAEGHKHCTIRVHGGGSSVKGRIKVKN
jgi:hypothetical protein